ncbi:MULTISPECIES: DUF6398 domain-containing protein [unclassified Clostridioides]|uniref:DUF6398 domain-containing protein n=1 Tax=unclassified Clostridioides TaxID=2635829 RepID=UPI001D0CB0DE|nr:hypothetical protein [Clostridioides sp. ES-S-0049-03]MCC0652725.1 hypothetical protein [Clostridioides sp. ES-S-0001-03]MCC0672750.1 hypothetical protein [Clostridioides sp. ES-S-0145-01]MCC0675317.1 hypothetical protein [Clostridioides sp. ES-W-0018-02]MCC0679934.1 hypothetical protein [Clostridioides sp. ES-S-0005-03]MCC0701971.1 hypothetical protein [Clostridioides sp. ES-S-0049-02]MCC0709873.1 hypothetical protein [Clostridioides sp. ES-W-0017-02]MCC0765017.1 hypothetical protein [Cl
MTSKIEEIKDKINRFCNSNLNQEYKDISFKILQDILDNNKEIIHSSRADIWSSAILNIVLEQNLLYNKKHPLHITKKEFSKKIGVSLNTINNKSSLIKDVCNIDFLNQDTIAISNIEFWVRESNSKSKAIDLELEKKKILYKRYIKLSQEAKNHIESIRYMEEAVNIGKSMITKEDRQLGFWKGVSTRAYMVALESLARKLESIDNLKEARKVLEYLIEINPDDEQGIRYKLLNVLIRLNDRIAINNLFEMYKEEKSATWMYSKALYYFKNKNMFLASDAIKSAKNKNKYIGLYLIDWRNAFGREFVTAEEKGEAVYYYDENIVLWNEVKGSMDWLLKKMLEFS